eukprot:9673493-Heterocapsa_arctica.AAC.1
MPEMALLPGCDDRLPDVVVQSVQTASEGDWPITLCRPWLANQDDLVEQGLPRECKLCLAVDQNL